MKEQEISKEIAKELINKYLQIYDGRVIEAKKCAIIAIDFAKNSRFSFQPMYGGWVSGQYYYDRIKEEIEKL